MTSPVEVQDSYGDIANVYSMAGRLFLTVVTYPGTSMEATSELAFTPEQAKAFHKAVKEARKAIK